MHILLVCVCVCERGGEGVRLRPFSDGDGRTIMFAVYVCATVCEDFIVLLSHQYGRVGFRILD